MGDLDFRCFLERVGDIKTYLFPAPLTAKQHSETIKNKPKLNLLVH